MPELTPAGLSLICKFEGFSEFIYTCPAGYPTIGYGHVVLPIEYNKFAAGIDEPEARVILQEDAYIAEKAVLRLVKVPLNDNQFSALVSFVYNLGSGAFQRSTLRQVINRGEHSAAPKQFMRWIYAGNTPLKGLISRRQAEAQMYDN